MVSFHSLIVIVYLSLLLVVDGTIQYNDLDTHLSNYDYIKLNTPAHQHFTDRENKIEPLTIHAFGKPYTLHLSLNLEFFDYIHPSEHPSVDRTTFIKGYVQGLEDASSVRLTLVEGGAAFEGIISLYESGQHQLYHIQTVQGKLNHPSSHGLPMIMYREQDHQELVKVDENHGCDAAILAPSGLNNQSTSDPTESSSILEKRQYSGSRVCTVGVVIDKLFVTQFGRPLAEQMTLQAFSQVDALYQQTFRVRIPVRTIDFAVNDQHPSNLNNANHAGDPLSCFTDAMSKNLFKFRTQDVCAAHLITHRDLGSLLGRAFIASAQSNVVGGVCSLYGNTAFSSSRCGKLVRSVPAIAKTIAHELGHNFGASHEANTACRNQKLTIMESVSDPALSIQSERFSACAVSSINKVLATSKVACMMPVGSRINRRHVALARF